MSVVLFHVLEPLQVESQDCRKPFDPHSFLKFWDELSILSQSDSQVNGFDSVSKF